MKFRIEHARLLCLTVLSLSACASPTAQVVNRLDEQERVFKAKQAELEEKMKGSLVYAKTDIAKGAVIDADSVEIRRLDSGRIPQDAITSVDLAVGRKAKYAMAAGDVVGQADVEN